MPSVADLLINERVRTLDRDARGNPVDRHWEIIVGEGDIGALKPHGVLP